MKTITSTNGTKIKVSEEDFNYLNQFNWSGKKYFYRTINGTKVALHHEVLNRTRSIWDLEIKLIPEHRDLDTLNNTRENLRWATRTQNNANCKPRSGRLYKGVYECKTKTGLVTYKARIKNNKKLITLGRFDNQIDAAMSYDKEARILHGEFARCNFPEATDIYYYDFLSRL
jgi:hypothetical protein